MILHNRALARVGAGFAGLLAAGAIAAPAYADDSADISVTGASSKIAVGVAAKDFRIDVHNAGPGVATDTTVTLDLSGLDPAQVDVDPAQFEGCEASGSSVVCAIGDGAAGETLQMLLSVKRVGDVGPAGSFTVTVKSAATDPKEDNNKATIPVEIVDSGPDLLALAYDVYAFDESGEPKPVLPGGTAPLFWLLGNQGDRTAAGVRFSITLPEHVTFVQGYGDCTTSTDERTMTCEFPDAQLEPGNAYFSSEEGLPVKVSEDAPGPVTLTGGMIKGGVISTLDPDAARVAVTSTAPEGLRVAELDKALELVSDVDEGDNDAVFSVFVGAVAGGGNGDDGDGDGGSGGGGSLPVTGVQAGVIGGVGLGVLAVGGVLFVLARRRRVVLVTPGDEKPTA